MAFALRRVSLRAECLGWSLGEAPSPGAYYNLFHQSHFVWATEFSASRTALWLDLQLTHFRRTQCVLTVKRFRTTKCPL